MIHDRHGVGSRSWAAAGGALLAAGIVAVFACRPGGGPAPDEPADRSSADAAASADSSASPRPKAAKPTVPAGIRFEAPESAAIGDAVALTVVAVAQRPVPDAVIEVTLPEELTLLSGDLSWNGPLEMSETVRLPLTVRVERGGEFAALAWIRFDGMGRRTELNVVADDRGVTLSSLPIELVRYRRALTDEERRRSLGTEGTPIEESDSKRRDGSGDDREDDRRGLGGPGITLRGKIVYEDSAGAMHPVRLAQVQIVQNPGGGRDCAGGHGPGAAGVLATAQTKLDGTYRATVTPANDPDGSAPDLQVRVLSRLTKPNQPTRQAVAFVEHYDANDLFFCESPLQVDVTADDVTVDFSVGRAVSGSVADPTTSRVFSVLDSVLQSAAGARFMRNGAVLPTLKVRFPYTGSVSFYDPTNVELVVLRADALDWDVLGHEFGHYLTDKGTTRTIDSNPGGSHSGCSAIGEDDGTGHARTKDEGIKLAWSEGQATFYGVAFQFVTDLALPGVPNSGDVTYHDTEDQVLSVNAEGPGDCAEGYGSEISVLRFLWDTYDSTADSDPGDATIADNVSVGLKTLWRLVTGANNDTLPKYYSYVAGRPATTLKALVKLGALLTLNGIAARLGAPDDQEIVSSVVSPTFSWTAEGDPDATYANNAFMLLISKDNFQTHMEWDAGAATSFTVPQADWRALFAGADENTVLRWIVLSRNTAAPATPSGGLLTGHWASHAHRFTPKAFEIKLTWPTIGADVDLHFRPPDGAGYGSWDYGNDCAYYNLNPDWGVLGDPSDNPSLDRDCITTCTEENITVDKVTTSGTYKIVVHYYNDHSLGDTVATVKILRFGRQIREASMGLSNPDHTPSSGSVWFAFEFDNP